MREEPPTPGTESADARHPRLDRYDTPDLVAAFVDDQALAAAAVQAAVPDIARAVDAALPRLRAGGRLIYVGAGTSGRLGVLDAVELGPTFGWPAERARALMAGGDPAMYVAVEGAEDDASQAAEDLHRLGPGEHDVVICVAASGRTPYVLGALQHARACGALTIGIASNAGSPLAAAAEVGITLDTGAEVISGSTRLKAGSAQKQVLNMLSTAVMNARGLIVRDEMVAMRPSNAKLRARAERIVRDLTGVDDKTAAALLASSSWHLPTALIRARHGIDADSARRHLALRRGSVRAAFDEAPR